LSKIKAGMAVGYLTRINQNGDADYATADGKLGATSASARPWMSCARMVGSWISSAHDNVDAELSAQVGDRPQSTLL
jgi:hypothetical protein